MERKHRTPDRIIRVGGREFRLYKYYEPFCGDYILDYPDFALRPEYTEDGRPFVMAVQEGCARGDSGNPENPDPGCCSGCVHFHQEPPPDDAIGICLCEARRRTERMIGDEREA